MIFLLGLACMVSAAGAFNQGGHFGVAYSLKEKHDRLEAENAELRTALDELNLEYEEIIGDVSAGDHEKAKTHLIRSLRQKLALRDT